MFSKLFISSSMLVGLLRKLSSNEFANNTLLIVEALRPAIFRY